MYRLWRNLWRRLELHRAAHLDYELCHSTVLAKRKMLLFQSIRFIIKIVNVSQDGQPFLLLLLNRYCDRNGIFFFPMLVLNAIALYRLNRIMSDMYCA